MNVSFHAGRQVQFKGALPEKAARAAFNLSGVSTDIVKAANDGSREALKTAGAKLFDIVKGAGKLGFNIFIAAPVRAVYHAGSKILNSSYLKGAEPAGELMHTKLPKRAPHISDEQFGKWMEGLRESFSKKIEPASAAVIEIPKAKAFPQSIPGWAAYENAKLYSSVQQ